MFLATLIHESKHINFGTGVINLGHRHPIVVAADCNSINSVRAATGSRRTVSDADGYWVGRRRVAAAAVN